MLNDTTEEMVRQGQGMHDSIVPASWHSLSYNLWYKCHHCTERQTNHRDCYQPKSFYNSYINLIHSWEYYNHAVQQHRYDWSNKCHTGYTIEVLIDVDYYFDENSSLHLHKVILKHHRRLVISRSTLKRLNLWDWLHVKHLKVIQGYHS